jgi:drug/metabolite transporter (DMT)-like permease
MWAWISLGIMSAWLTATSDLFCKRALDRGLPPLTLAFWRSLFALPVLLPILLRGLPEIDPIFWWLHLVWVPTDVLAMFLYFYSVKHAPLSLSVPLSGVALIVTTVAAWLLRGEALTLVTLMGMASVLVGSYLLNLKPQQTGWFGPFRAVATDRGVQAMVLAASLFGFNSVIAAYTIRASDAAYMSLHYMLVYTLVLLPFAWRGRAVTRPRVIWLSMVPAGILFGFMFWTLMEAIALTNVAYISALRRFAGPFSVLYGWLLFGEQSIRMRIVGSLVILAGAILIAQGAARA